MKKSFLQNWRLYLMEAWGLTIFMISACFFGSLLEARDSAVHQFIRNDFIRLVTTGVLMGATALYIFYSRWTAPSGSHINPAVTLAFLRTGRIPKYDAFFYIGFQFLGGTLAVYFMQALLGTMLTAAPVNSAVTAPGRYGIYPALVTEFITAFIMMTTVLFTSDDERVKKFTRPIAGCLVCTYVIIAGPVSGFGMNPARTFASALPAHTWTAFWIYMILPVAGMMAAAECFLFIRNFKKDKTQTTEFA
jgi:aquaporin Z